jgi:hypothetical protein
MARFVIEHRHQPHECAVVFAAFKGHASPLRKQPAPAACRYGEHAIWWTVEAVSAAEALAALPRYVASRSRATRVSDVVIP